MQKLAVIVIFSTLLTLLGGCSLCQRDPGWRIEDDKIIFDAVEDALFYQVVGYDDDLRPFWMENRSTCTMR